MGSQIRIILADDHKMFRDGMVQLLQQQPGLSVVAEAADGNMLVELTRKWVPDIIFADINMPLMNGFEATKIIKKEFPAIPVIALSMKDDASDIKEMLEAGAMGYMLKNAGKVELKKAIEAVRNNQQYLCPGTAMTLSREKAKIIPIRNKTSLTTREVEVLLLLCKEYKNKQIAKKLHISLRTVEGHRDHVKSKTGSKNTAGLIIYAVRNGLMKL